MTHLYEQIEQAIENNIKKYKLAIECYQNEMIKLCARDLGFQWARQYSEDFNKDSVALEAWQRAYTKWTDLLSDRRTCNDAVKWFKAFLTARKKGCVDQLTRNRFEQHRINLVVHELVAYDIITSILNEILRIRTDK